MPTPDPPIACTLTPGQLRARQAALLPGLAARARRIEALPDGVRLEFDAADGLLMALARVIEAERECCRFLSFTVAAAPELGPVTLDVRGPAGTAEFLASLVGQAR